jgi:ADP-dependent phosphofructokinase/glucokinase
MALQSRSREQLDVLSPDVFVCSEGRMVPVHELSADADAAPIRNEILEFPGDSGLVGSSADRFHRVIVRFSPIALERDEHFMAMQANLGPSAGAAMLAGLNGLAVSDGTSLEWVDRLLRTWQEFGPALRHLELGDTTRPGDLRTIMAGLRGLNSSVGLSLSELLTLWGSSTHVAGKALELAHCLECPCIVVHADRWSLAVHRSDPGTVIRRLMTGNLLASARAAAGAPCGDVTPVSYTLYAEDVPESGPLNEDWRVDCVPAPFVPRPASTIGLGDTFVAGLLLAAALEGT